MSARRETLTDSHKEAVKAWVPKVRKVIEADLSAQLDRLGIRKNTKPTPVEQMNLSTEARDVRAHVEALLNRESLAEGAARARETVLRELAYTLLNRLVGLKSMEARRLLRLPPPSDPEGEPEETEVITLVEGQ